MRVLMVMASGERGGGADHLLGVMPELAARGVECLAAVGSNGPLAAELRAAGFAVRPLDLMGSRTDPRGVFEVARAAAAARPDLVHLHGTRAGFFGALARVAGRWPSVYTAHGLSYRKAAGVRRRAFTVAEAVACRGASRVVSVSGADLDDLMARRLLARGLGTHVPNAVDHTRFTGDRASARAKLRMGEDGFVVGTVARLVAQKAVHDLIEAIGQCSPGVRLLIIGDGPRRRVLEQMARRRLVDATFLGERDDVPALLPAFDLFALSSRWEGEPVALLEAMTAGVPWVATATAGAGEAPSEAGRLVGIGRPEEMAAAIEALRADPEARTRLGSAGRAAMAERTFANLATRLLDVYGACRPA